MIRPAISPRRITGSATAGIVNAARSGVRNIKDITETISNEPEVTKEERFGINYVGFFGSRRVNKDLKKSMKTITDSVGSTFGIAKSLKESQKGILFAAVLKLILPIIVVIPGIAAFVMIKDTAMYESFKPDNAYPWLLQLLPSGLKGLAFAALTAAIVSSLASMLNSTSTIFTMDIYKQYIRPNANDKETVNTGRISAAVALLVAGIMAPLLGGIDQAFQFIQEYTGVVSPGILAVFVLGLFWKKTTNKGAIIGTLSSIPIAMYFKVAPKGWSNNSFFLNDIPFLDQMGYTALITMVVIVIASHVQNRGNKDIKGIEISKETFKTSTLFNVISFAIMLILIYNK